MMRSLLRKEIFLSSHPTAPMFLALSAMLLIPNYPYYVVFFYTSLAIYFTCLLGRENNDVVYSLLLPVSGREVVRARMLYAVLLEAAQLLLAIPFSLLRQHMPVGPNAAGMDAGIALFGLSLIQLGIFNFTFFTAYYRDVRKVGVSFLKSCILTFVYVGVMETLDHVLPLFRDRLDTPDPQFLTEKLVTLAIGIVCFAALTWASYRISVRRFEAQDF